MRILALETSGSSGSVAALSDRQLIAERSLTEGQGSAQSLAPAIDRLLAEVGWEAQQVELVAATSGPGSFTGLRIGVTTAKAFAYAATAAVLGVNTLQVIARQAGQRRGPLWAVMDAQRGELFAARFAAGQQHDEQQPTVEVIDLQSWVARLTPGDTVTGPGLIRLASALGGQVHVVEQEAWQPRAGAVGLLAYEQFLAGRREEMFQFVPRYFRRAAAEEQWQRRGGPAR